MLSLYTPDADPTDLTEDEAVALATEAPSLVTMRVVYAEDGEVWMAILDSGSTVPNPRAETFVAETTGTHIALNGDVILSNASFLG